MDLFTLISSGSAITPHAKKHSYSFLKLSLLTA